MFFCVMNQMIWSRVCMAAGIYIFFKRLYLIRLQLVSVDMCTEVCEQWISAKSSGVLTLKYVDWSTTNYMFSDNFANALLNSNFFAILYIWSILQWRIWTVVFCCKSIGILQHSFNLLIHYSSAYVVLTYFIFLKFCILRPIALCKRHSYGCRWCLLPTVGKGEFANY